MPRANDKGMAKGSTEGKKDVAAATTTPTSRTTKGDSNRDNFTSLAQLGNDVSRVLRKLNRCERATSELYALAWEACKTKHRFAIQEWAEWIRAHEVTDSNGKPFTISNSDTAIVARILLEHMPECRPYLELRASKYDACFHDPYGAVES